MQRYLSEKPVHAVHSDQTMLASSPLSFFDPFVPVDGIPAFLLNPEAEGDEKIWDSNFDRAVSSGSEKVYSYDAPQHITCFAFSDDGSRLATGHNSGAVSVWDVHRGRRHKTTKLHDGTVCCASFRGRSRNVILTGDKTGSVVEWSLNEEIKDDAIVRMDCGEEWNRRRHQKASSHKPKFFEGGNVIVFPVKDIPDDKDVSSRRMKMQFFIVATNTMRSTFDTRRLEVTIKSTDVVTRMELSSGGKGFLVGITDDDVEQGYIVVWPDIHDRPEHSVVLKGTMGSWSPNGRRVVTWTVPEDPFPQDNDACYAFIWDVTNFHRCLELKNPSGKNVLWCRFVSDAEGHEHLAMCVLGRKLKLIFWDIETHHVTHVIDTSYPLNTFIFG